jgi:hypothetical protein
MRVSFFQSTPRGNFCKFHIYSKAPLETTDKAKLCLYLARNERVDSHMACEILWANIGRLETVTQVNNS